MFYGTDLLSEGGRYGLSPKVTPVSFNQVVTIFSRGDRGGGVSKEGGGEEQGDGRRGLEGWVGGVETIQSSSFFSTQLLLEKWRSRYGHR